MDPTDSLDALGERLGLIYGSEWSHEVEELLFRPDKSEGCYSIDEALELIEVVSGNPLPGWLLPLAWVDPESMACVVTSDDGLGIVTIGEVRRLFLHPVRAGNQLALIDIDPLLFVASLEEELRARTKGLRRVLDQIGPAYERSHLEKEKRPRDFVVRPVRIACQNVIVALGAIAHDSTFDGLSVPAWQTCEVPHVATHEANRALAALTLCDAFQSGGTMEIRFDRKARILHKGHSLDYDGHPEMAVPASLRRFGRTVGVDLGAQDSAAITPREARELFLAITPMPAALRRRVDDAVEHQGIPPERICFLLLSQVWREIEMDYLLATSGRSTSILSGGAEWTDRLARQAESASCRGAVTVGMLFRRLNSTDGAAGDKSVVRVVEDHTKGIEWEIHPDEAAVTFVGLDPTEPVPWTFGLTGIDTLTVFPRTAICPEALAEIDTSELPGHKVLLVPADAPTPPQRLSGTVLRCPDRLADIDKSIEDRLLKSRISR
ncbi:hypothetical protein GCM10012320_35510 [Sinomonas cellulolyticus]|uniref:Uncharacterized protein n=1 Tax=Sinomonas cellulolyticus TaxID=2801916 RepID=A0ABS1K0W5_9MICC|nr:MULTISPECIES: hypothetical protein [Sinomonas]MBL0705113.1 hypothetical protein [Sinomonas cellulolyticus]GHG60796.1 hypothetical protein GCM10012320_35510 [Sinomonas sp. KCTC 49339]